MDKGLIKPIFVAPSWKLARRKNLDYGISCQVLANIVSSDIEKISEFKRYYNTFIFDEVSMYNQEIKW
jgi:hypothetical protein